MYVTFDLETLGNTSNAPIVQIGAAVFDIDGQIHDIFIGDCDLHTIPDGFHVDYSTIKWWLSQMAKNPELSVVFVGSTTHKKMLEEFRDWTREIYKKFGADLTYWSHATFDPPILTNNCKVAGITDPIKFRNHRDIRTLTHLAGYFEVKRKGNHHNAYDDAKYQAEYIAKGLRTLRDKGVTL